MNFLEGLPVTQQFGLIQKQWDQHDHLVVKSPTGSGKSIGLPSIMVMRGLVNGQVLVVQPRRIAARLLAKKVAEVFGCEVGKEVGYQVKFEDQTSSSTKLIYLTDGVLMRKLMDDPTLSRIGLVIFDEFHERSLQSDFSLALVRKLYLCQRPSLRCVVMSATIDLDRVQKYLPNCGKVSLSTRSFPVRIEHRALKTREKIWNQVAEELKKIHSHMPGNILVFMDGASEIIKTVRAVLEKPFSSDFEVLPLFGEMSLSDQDRVIGVSGKRKIIVSTNIAETSLTIDGVRLVIDLGTAKKASFDPIRGINVLLSQPVSKSSADQRAGRAGRISHGYCLRLWSLSEHQTRNEFEIPEVQRVDLSEIYLNLISIGESPDSIHWFDEWPGKSRAKAYDTLLSLRAITSDGMVSSHGQELSKIPLHPKLSNALWCARNQNCLSAFAILLSFLEQRSPVDSSKLVNFAYLPKDKCDSWIEQSDLHALFNGYEKARKVDFVSDECKELGLHGLRFREAEKNAERLCKLLGCRFQFQFPSNFNFLKVLIECFPEKILRIKNRGTGIYESFDGLKMHLSNPSLARKSEWILGLRVLEKSFKGKVGLAVDWACPLPFSLIEDRFRHEITEDNSILLDLETRKVVRRTALRLNKIIIRTKESHDVSEGESATAYAKAILCGSLNLKYWDARVRGLLARIEFLADNFPSLGIERINDDDKLLILEEICAKKKHWKQIRSSEVLPSILSTFDDEKKRILESAAPNFADLHNGKKPYLLRYESKDVFLSVKLQELYEVDSHPCVAFGKYPISLEILAPNGRPVQTTKDLNGFWSGSYLQMKKELAGRYPKHDWR